MIDGWPTWEMGEEHLAMARTVCWFSAGAASAIATRLMLRQQPEAVVAYCETGAEHPDNERFIADCVRWFNRPVERLHSEKYESTWDVYEQRRYLAGIDGALCTTELSAACAVARHASAPFESENVRHVVRSRHVIASMSSCVFPSAQSWW